MENILLAMFGAAVLILVAALVFFIVSIVVIDRWLL